MPTVKETATSSSTRWIKLFLKLAITVFCLWYISKKIDWKIVVDLLGKTNWLFFAVAVLLYVCSKIVAAARLNLYFRDISLNLPGKTNLKLYWLGLFYNLFLPGSIGGDAYKVIQLGRQTGISYKKLTAAVVLDRVTGLLGLGAVLVAYGFIVLKNYTITLLLVFGLLLAIGSCYFIIRKWFNDHLQSFWKTFTLGLVVQLFSNASTYFVLFALGIDQQLNEYIFMYLIASIAAILPLTIGGLGAREIVFLELSPYFGISPYNAVLAGLMVYLTILISSAWGLVYIFANPLNTSVHEFPTVQKNSSQ